MSYQKYFATTALHLEPLLADELLNLGASDIEIHRSGVSFFGDLKLLYKVNIFSRLAIRVLKPIKEFSAKNQTMLYSQVYRLHWEDFLNEKTTFAVNVTFGGEKNLELKNSMFVGQKIKDAIVDRLRKILGKRPNVDKKTPDIKIHAYLNQNRCTLSFDSSGHSLHERGYRKHPLQAPLKENLAAALVLSTNWDKESTFLDPFCGSGTIAIEAAMLAKNIAPGLLKEDFGFMHWKDFDKENFIEVVSEAKSKIKKIGKKFIYAFDKDPKAVKAAKENAKLAFVDDIIEFGVFDFFKISKNNFREFGENKVIVMNPPYGERLKVESSILDFYKKIGDTLKQNFTNWTAYLFTGNLDAIGSIGLRTSKRQIFYNGAIESRLLKFELYEGTKKNKKEKSV
jgi:putative N6-adenine-specific DNA methylase